MFVTRMARREFIIGSQPATRIIANPALSISDTGAATKKTASLHENGVSV